VCTGSAIALRSTARVGSASTKLPVSTSTSPASVANAVTFAKLETNQLRGASSSATNRGAIGCAVSIASVPFNSSEDSSRRVGIRLR
jgi:hypothetical protein